MGLTTGDQTCVRRGMKGLLTSQLTETHVGSALTVSTGGPHGCGGVAAVETWNISDQGPHCNQTHAATETEHNTQEFRNLVDRNQDFQVQAILIL